jgi:CheY-like chemotaxis protein
VRYSRADHPRILLVEDDDALREVVGECLRSEGYLVDEAPDGLAALDVCARRPPDAVVLDLVMPKLDGWEFLDRIRADRRLRDVPVLVATGAQVDDPSALGVMALLQKPFDMDVLLHMVRDVLLGGRDCHAFHPV